MGVAGSLPTCGSGVDVVAAPESGWRAGERGRRTQTDWQRGCGKAYHTREGCPCGMLRSDVGRGRWPHLPVSPLPASGPGLCVVLTARLSEIFRLPCWCTAWPRRLAPQSPHHAVDGAPGRPHGRPAPGPAGALPAGTHRHRRHDAARSGPPQTLRPHTARPDEADPTLSLRQRCVGDSPCRRHQRAALPGDGQAVLRPRCRPDQARPGHARGHQAVQQRHPRQVRARRIDSHLQRARS